ncbi:hypothetical protein [Streptomyces viridosporus]|uniref:hypothetical protein n=1 Tax=Streptomyces viridosporus TaxID=67581 RepID=UPI0033325F54
MRGKSEAAGESSVPEEGKRRRVELSVPQVAGSAAATVLGAQLASSFGVYGTILGAGVVSVVATCGGTLFQHFFTRTGEQVRGATARAGRTGERTPPAPGEFTEGTVYRAKRRAGAGNWKRPVAAAFLVFAVAMTGITAYELASGRSLSGERGTTVGDAVSGSSGSTGRDPGPSDGESGTSGPFEDSDRDEPAPTPTGIPGVPEGTGPTDGASPEGTYGPVPSPEITGTEDPGVTSPDPGTSLTPPGPSADGRSETGAPGRDGPAVP